MLLTFLLITAGGIVHNTGSSMDCGRDWPGCLGQGLFPAIDHIGVFWEHYAHRMVGMVVGFLSIALMAAAAILQQRRLLYMTTLLTGLVIVQGLLGMATVKMNISPLFSTLHLTLSQVVIGASLWVYLSVRQLQAPPSLPKAEFEVERTLIGLLLLLFSQLVLGAYVRHIGAGPVCGIGVRSMLMCIDVADHQHVWYPSLFLQQLHMAHRALGGLIVLALPLLTRYLSRRAMIMPAVHRLLRRACVLAMAQVALGLWTVASGLDVTVTTFHLVGACLLWLHLVAAYFESRGARLGWRPITPRGHRAS